jgi:hypothetical protein
MITEEQIGLLLDRMRPLAAVEPAREVLDEAAAAALLGVSAATLAGWRKARTVPAVTVGKTVLYSRAALLDWLRDESYRNIGGQPR